MAKVKIAAHQMRVTPDIDSNFLRIKEGIELASSKDARLIAFPECALSGYPPLHHASVQDIDMLKIAELNDKISQLARVNDIWVVLGTIVMSSDGLLNSALLISNSGEIIGRYDKLHLMPDDKKYFVPGTGVPAFTIGGMTMGMLICYDARFPEPFRYLREMGSQLIVNISNACGGDTWKAPVLEGTYRARASENSCYLIAVNAAGPLQMGTSRIVNPLGLDLASANMDREEIIFADIDLAETDTGYFFDRRMDQFKIEPLFEI